MKIQHNHNKKLSRTFLDVTTLESARKTQNKVQPKKIIETEKQM